MLDKDNTCSHRLVGKFFTNSTPPSLEETEQTVRKLWDDLNGDMTVQKLEDTFLFEFSRQEDKENVLEGSFFYVNEVILVIKDPDSSETIDFTVASFFVLVMGLPFYLFHKENYPTIKSEFGHHRPFLGKTINDNLPWLLMDVDLKKPLKPGFYVDENWFVQFKYMDLGDFCYNCGMIGHVKENCDRVKFPEVRNLNATSKTHVYGPWLRLEVPSVCYESVLNKSWNGVSEFENTLSYPHFFIEIEFNTVYVCSPRSETKIESTHRFRFPCSYLDTETESESTDSTITVDDSKAYEVLRREIYENTPWPLDKFEEKSDFIGSLVEELKFKKNNEFYSEDKWLTLKLQINEKCMLPPVDYETQLAISQDQKCQRSTESKISDLIKKRVDAKEDLLCFSTWENQIREVMSEVVCTQYKHLLNVSIRAKKARLEGVWMEISSSSCPIPADRSTFSGLNHFKVVGYDMDRLDQCMICVGEMFLGEEATSLPCSHVFHSSCIEKWLQVGHKCPLCGFKLPTQ